jgi:hypothetical protein
VFGVPDERLGETVAASLVFRDGAAVSESELREFLAEHIASFKIPAHFRFHGDALPRIATGKIFKRQLKQSSANSWAPDNNRPARPAAPASKETGSWTSEYRKNWHHFWRACASFIATEVVPMEEAYADGSRNRRSLAIYRASDRDSRNAQSQGSRRGFVEFLYDRG